MSVLDLGARSVRKDTLVIYFHQSWSKISPALKENRSALDSILYIVRNYSHNPNFHMHVEGWASPEGAQSFNDTLARDRAESIRIWAEQHAGFRIPGNLMTVRGMGIDWTGLDSLLVEAEGLRGREEALEIVRNVPVWVYENGRIVGSRRKSLMDLNGGELYQSLMHTLFVPLRRAEIILEYEPMPQVEAVKAYISEVAALDESPMTPQVSPLEHIPLYRLALKTNLLTDAILMPSLELEWLINDEWSVAAHGAVAWWSRKPRHQYYQIAAIYPEARWWFKTKSRGTATTSDCSPAAAGTISRTADAATRAKPASSESATGTCSPSAARFHLRSASEQATCSPATRNTSPYRIWAAPTTYTSRPPRCTTLGR